MSKFGMEDRIARLGGGFADLPNTDAVVSAAGDEAFATRSESGGIKLLEGLGKSVAPLAGSDVPEFYRAVGAGAGEDFSIGAKGEVIDAAIVARESFDFLAGFQIPQFDFLVV